MRIGAARRNSLTGRTLRGLSLGSVGALALILGPSKTAPDTGATPRPADALASEPLTARPEHLRPSRAVAATEPTNRVARIAIERPAPPLSPARPAPTVARVPVAAAATPPLVPADRAVIRIAIAAPPALIPPSPAPLAPASPAPASPPASLPARPLSDAYIAQVEPDGAADPRGLALASEAMQVSPNLALASMERSRVAMLATAPTNVVLRVGDTMAGEVAIAMVSSGTIGVKLADLLDLVGPRMDAGRLAALRGSQAAQTFVTLEELRKADLTISYDPVYDELQLHG